MRIDLTDRQWNQLRAALAFWRAVAKASRVHPMVHPAAKGYFGADKPTPLTDPEIKALIDRAEEKCTTALQMAREYKISCTTLLGAIQVADLTEHHKHDFTRYYPEAALRELAIIIRKREDQHAKIRQAATCDKPTGSK